MREQDDHLPDWELVAVMGGGDTQINKVKSKLTDEMSQAGSQGLGLAPQFLDGDQHRGSLICRTTINQNGGDVSLSAYSTTSLPSSLCKAVKSDIGGP
jgi:hypothetical protein